MKLNPISGRHFWVRDPGSERVEVAVVAKGRIRSSFPLPGGLEAAFHFSWEAKLITRRVGIAKQDEELGLTFQAVPRSIAS
jgi:hypothetical protein